VGGRGLGTVLSFVITQTAVIQTLEDRTDMLSRNVGKELQLTA